jgi:hypothetical protein
VSGGCRVWAVEYRGLSGFEYTLAHPTRCGTVCGREWCVLTCLRVCLRMHVCVCARARMCVRACACIRVLCVVSGWGWGVGGGGWGVGVGGCREKRTCGENGGELGLILELCDGKKFVPVAGLPR